MVKAVRGAVSLDQNTEKDLQQKVDSLFNEVIIKNNIKTHSIVSIIFSQTPDITFNPAKALRMTNDLKETPLFCTQEPVCEDFPQKMMLRILLTFNSDLPGTAKPIYMGEAAGLRKDISGSK
ncbi:MAG: chorismate mutase [Spirochaetales bacterium]|nr:chorismate mutase [Spirochaetales bacterium]